MTASIAQRRLGSSGLGRARMPREAVASMGAVQAQDFGGALWALGLRTGEDEAAVGRAFDAGEILRTHVLRPTWHLVAPKDLRAFQALTAPRVRMLLRTTDAKLGLDAATLRRAHAVLERELDGAARTRDELAAALTKAKLACTGTRLVHVMMHAELDSMICSGPRRGKQHTYALLDHRVQSTPIPSRERILGDLTGRYFASHGPARAIDFAWWSRLTLADVRRGIELAPGIVNETIDGVEYFRARRSAPGRGPTFLLLPCYDEMLVAYRDRTASVEARTAKRLGDGEMLLRKNVVVRDGIVVGTWTRTLARRGVSVAVTLVDAPTRADREAIVKQAERYGAFLGLQAECRFAR